MPSNTNLYTHSCFNNLLLQDEYIWALVNQNTDQHNKILQKISQKETQMEQPKGKLNDLHKAKAKMEKEQLKETEKLQDERKK